MPSKRNTTPEKVIQTAINLANAQGFEQVTLANVARELGIRVPSLYNHLDGLKGLHKEITLWGLRQLAIDLRQAAIGKAGDDALISIAHAYRAFAHAQPGIYPQTLRAVSPDEPELVAAAQELLAIVFTVLQHYQLSREDVIHVIRAFRSVLHGFVDLEILSGFEMPLNSDESFQRLLDVFIAGLRSQYGGFKRS